MQPKLDVNRLNDDECRIVLSFLSALDLARLQSASKRLSICKLALEDNIWRPLYESDLQSMIEESSYEIQKLL